MKIREAAAGHEAMICVSIVLLHDVSRACDWVCGYEVHQLLRRQYAYLSDTCEDQSQELQDAKSASRRSQNRTKDFHIWLAITRTRISVTKILASRLVDQSLRASQTLELFLTNATDAMDLRK